MPVALPTVDIKPHKFIQPTGFEAQQAQVALQQKLAEAMMSQGLTPHDDYKSWLQPIAQIFQAWAGKSMGKDAAKTQGHILDQQLQMRGVARQNMLEDLQKGGDPSKVLGDYGNNPLLQDDPSFKALAAAVQSRMEGDQKITTFGGRGMRAGDTVGQIEPSKPNDSVLRMPDGSWKGNPVKATFDLRAQGYKPGVDFTPVDSMQDPYADLRKSMTGAQSIPEQPAVDPILTQARQEGSAVLNHNLAVPTYDPKTGRTWYKINGDLYDNPEGK